MIEWFWRRRTSEDSKIGKINDMGLREGCLRDADRGTDSPPLRSTSVAKELQLSTRGFIDLSDGVSACSCMTTASLILVEVSLPSKNLFTLPTFNIITSVSLTFMIFSSLTPQERM